MPTGNTRADIGGEIPNQHRCEAQTKAGAQCKQQSRLVIEYDGKWLCGVHCPGGKDRALESRAETQGKKDEAKAILLDVGPQTQKDLYKPTYTQKDQLDQLNALFTHFMAGKLDKADTKLALNIMYAKGKCLEDVKDDESLISVDLDKYTDKARGKVLTFMEEFPELSSGIRITSKDRNELMQEEYEPQLEFTAEENKTFDEQFETMEEMGVHPNDAFPKDYQQPGEDFNTESPPPDLPIGGKDEG